jgi:hypothetical protein
MTSQKQIEANRRNAKRSTGPKTLRGRYRARMNAKKHGLRGHEGLLPDEDPAEFESFRENMFRDLRPNGFLESELADRVVYEFWILRRCERIGAGLLGGGTYVMDTIASKTLEEFAEMLDPKENPEDMSPAQLAGEMLLCQGQRYRLKTQEIEKNPHKYDSSADDDSPFDQSFVDLHDQLCESEQQKNPLTYDIALAFRKDLSQQEALAKLARYETTHSRALQRSLQDLHRVQDRRRKASTSQPDVIEVDPSGGSE